ncbi:MAG: response regulator transcription factor [Syntrophales bacterium]|jgi:DNA-binding NarL/FixJ family response regulator|nr:response regulator transcription factor [Syntrophales bacterium]MDY0043668.1 response regulator transcription factor [Syntrophales bacterium]
MDGRKFRIFIAEDQTLVRESLRAILVSHPDFEVVGEASDGMTAIRSVEKIKPDLILIDLNLPKMSGIAALRSIKKQVHEARILVLTDDDNENYVTEVFRLGGNGYCLKDVTGEELVVAIRNVLSGKPYVSASILGNFLHVFLKTKKENFWGPLQKLSFREKDILKLIGEGHSIREIAEYLYISRRTAERHRYNIMKKLDLHRTADLKSFALENGLVSKNSVKG